MAKFKPGDTVVVTKIIDGTERTARGRVQGVYISGNGSPMVTVFFCLGEKLSEKSKPVESFFESRVSFCSKDFIKESTKCDYSDAESLLINLIDSLYAAKEAEENSDGSEKSLKLIQYTTRKLHDNIIFAKEYCDNKR